MSPSRQAGGPVSPTALADTVPFEPTRPAEPALPDLPARRPSVVAPAAARPQPQAAGPQPSVAAQAATARPEALAQAALRRAAAGARSSPAAASAALPSAASKPASARAPAPASAAAPAAPAAPAPAAPTQAPAATAGPAQLQVQQPALRRPAVAKPGGASAPGAAASVRQPQPAPPLARAAAAPARVASASANPPNPANPASPASQASQASQASRATLAPAAPSHLAAPPAVPGASPPAGRQLQTAEDTAWVQAALRLLQFEQEIRGLPDLTALQMHLVNDAQAVLGFDQAIVWRRHRGTGRLRPVMASGLPTLDREAPTLRALTRVLRRLQRGRQLEAVLKLDLHNRERLPRLRPADRQALAGLSLRHGLWYPMPDRDGSYHAGVLFLHHRPFPAGAPRLMGRLAATYAHAWRALGNDSSLAEGRRWPWLAAALCVPLVVGGALVPVRLSVMAPVEVVAAAPQVVTAPISGVVRQILVSPSAPVSAGTPLLQFDDIQPRNEMLLAQQRLAVAQARDARTAAAAFSDPAAAHELATAQAELQLARVAYDYAVEVLKRTQVLAPQAGVAIYSDRRDWEGRAVQVGEEVLQVADPSRVAYKVALSAGNSIQLQPGSQVDVYLADAPLGGLPATLRSISYTPQPQPGGEASYVVMADTAGDSLPRIGARGTARLYGDTVPLAVQLLRRPLAALRQWVGL